MSKAAPRPRRAPASGLGALLLLAVACAWGLTISDCAWEATWPRTDLVPTVQALAWAIPIALILAGGLATHLRGGRGEVLLPYALILGALWLPHASPVLLRASVNDWGRPYRVLADMAQAQTSFRERDLDRDDQLDYGTLEELLATDASFGALAKYSHYLESDQPLRGYRYRIELHPLHPEFMWAAVANPADPDPQSPQFRHALAYAVTYEGELVADLAPLELGPNFELPPTAVPYPGGSDELIRRLHDRPIANNRFWRKQIFLGLHGTLTLFGFTALGLAVWLFRLGPFHRRREASSTPANDA